MTETLKKEDFKQIYKNTDSFVGNKTVRTRALQLIDKLSFPTQKDEAWRNTNLRNVLADKYQLPEGKAIDEEILAEFKIPGLISNVFVFVNGVFQAALSKIVPENSSPIVLSMKNAYAEYPDIFKSYFDSNEITSNHIFTALNAAYATDGAFIYIPKNSEAKTPIHIIHLVDGSNEKTLTQLRNLIVAEENSRLNVIETYHSLSINTTLTNVATEIVLKPNARVEYDLLQGESDEAFHINNIFVRQERESVFCCNTISMCGGLVRNELKIDVKGEYCETNLNGLSLADRNQHFDNKVTILHTEPNSTSNQNYKGIVDNNASTVFFGKVYVAQKAQKTNANQSNKNILLSEKAKVNSKPQLEIYADDVRCSHGSTTGQIDEEVIFYLQTRGISRENAVSFLLYAFTKEVMEKIKCKALRQHIDDLVSLRMKGEKKKSFCTLIKASK